MKRLLTTLPIAAIPLTLGIYAGSRRIPLLPDLRTANRASDVWIVDRTGHLLHELRVDKTKRQLPWTPLAEISPTLIDALLRTEDHRFRAHPGVDPLAIASALVNRVSGKPLRGASTITMQLAKIVLRENETPRPRALTQKFEEALYALALERKLSKDEILEAYLNLVDFRGELRGVRAASRGLFGKDPHGLTYEEAAVLASLIARPNASTSTIAKRACIAAAATDCTPFATLAARTSTQARKLGANAGIAPHLADRVLAELDARGDSSPATITAEASAPLQSYALELVRDQLIELRRKNAKDMAVLVVENATGAVKAYVGNSGKSASAVYVDGVRARRQAGSTLKPFVYALAFEKRVLTPSSILDDAPFELAMAGGVYRPRNYDTKFRGPVTVATALASSLNVPAVKALTLVDADELIERLRLAGFDVPHDAAHYGPSLALGSLDVSLEELVRAYRLLALGGIAEPLHFASVAATPSSSSGGGTRVYSQGAVASVSTILADRASRAPTFGWGNHLATPFYSAVKTGTSKDMRDNWCVGYSRRYTVGVWVGNFDGSSMWNVSGVSGAAPVWAKLMRYLEGDSAMAAAETASVALPGPDAALQALAERPRITYPVEGSIIALDPDMPAERQGLVPTSTASSERLAWKLDGRHLASARIPLRNLRGGSHVLSLHSVQGKAYDEVRFTLLGQAQ